MCCPKEVRLLGTSVGDISMCIQPIQSLETTDITEILSSYENLLETSDITEMQYIYENTGGQWHHPHIILYRRTQPINFLEINVHH